MRLASCGATGAGADLRDALLDAAIASGVLVTAVCEVLSPARALTRGWLLAVWGLALLALVFGGWRRTRAPRPIALRRRPPLDLAMLAWTGVVVAVTGALALLLVPTTWDSMTYHLARVAHWAQNRSAAFYPTHVIRQLYQPPWAEWAVLQLYVLAGGDRLANLVQWASMLASLVGVSVIARQLGAGARGQILAAFVCATIPMGIQQSATTQNDYVAALWLVCLASALLRLAAQPGLLAALPAGASLGLALLTKGTAYIFAAPFLLAFLVGARRRGAAVRLVQAAVVVVIALALNAPQGLRNAEVFGSPLGPGGEGDYRYTNDAFSPAVLASNVLRNVGLHVGTPWRAANAAIERAIDVAHAAIGIRVDDPRSTWPTTRFAVLAPAAHEDLAPNGLHLVLLLAAIAGAWSRPREGRVAAYAGCLVLGFLLFCLLLRWQPWHSRLHLPLFVLGAALMGAVGERLRPALLGAALVALAGSSLYFLTDEGARLRWWAPLDVAASRPEQRMARAAPGYVGAARFLASGGCHDVGFVLASDDPEYMLWTMLADAGWRGRLEAVLIANPSAVLPYVARGPFDPCAIVRTGANVGASELFFEERYYRPAWSRHDVQVLVPAPPPVPDPTVGPPAARLLLQGARFRPGDRVAIGIDARNPADGVPADLFVGIILPDGGSAVFVGPSGLLGDAVSLADASAYPRARPVPVGFALNVPVLVEFTVPTGLVPGTYRVFATLVKRRAARAPVIPAADILASDMREVVLAP